MTMSAQIVNTSNWQGEDVLVDLGNGNFQRVRPGEMMYLNLYPIEQMQNIRIIPAPAEDTEPFQDEDGGQVVPVVEVVLR